MAQAEPLAIEFEALKTVVDEVRQGRRGAAADALLARVGMAYGPAGMGVLLVHGVPQYARLRQDLLPYSSRLAQLPEEEKAAIVDAESFFQFGWSQGNEFLDKEKRMPDLYKGGFFANPTLDVPTTDAALVAAHPTCCHANVWPSAALPGLKSAFQALGACVVDVGLLVAQLCDIYVMDRLDEQSRENYRRIADTIESSRALKARLLHYFPRGIPAEELRRCRTKETAPGASPAAEPRARGEREEEEGERGVHEGGKDMYCNWHTDISSLTGLTAAMWQRSDGEEAPAPDATCGLHVKTRARQKVRVEIPPHAIAFQIGKTAELASGGLLCATPHAVLGPKEASQQLARNTFAVFMQPSWDEELQLPCPRAASPARLSASVRSAWQPGMHFSAFMTALLRRSY